jgi:hypothetical protein
MVLVHRRSGRSIQEATVAIATAPASAPETFFRPQGREIATDRWEGLMLDRVDPDVPSDLSNRLVAITAELAGGMGRENADSSSVQDDLIDAIREWLVLWVEAGGESPTDAGEEFVFTLISSTSLSVRAAVA